MDPEEEAGDLVEELYDGAEEEAINRQYGQATMGLVIPIPTVTPASLQTSLKADMAASWLSPQLELMYFFTSAAPSPQTLFKSDGLSWVLRAR